MSVYPAVSSMSSMDSPSLRLEEATMASSRMLGEKETKWAIGGAALGLTVAIVEYLASNVFENRDSQFAERRGDFSKKKMKSQKFKDVLKDQRYTDYYDYYQDYSNAFGQDDYNSQFRDVISNHYAKDDFYDYEDYSYSQFFRQTFTPKPEPETQMKVNKLAAPDVYKKYDHSEPKTSSLNRKTEPQPSLPSR